MCCYVLLVGITNIFWSFWLNGGSSLEMGFTDVTTPIQVIVDGVNTTLVTEPSQNVTLTVWLRALSLSLFDTLLKLYLLTHSITSV
jgi:hypothetical protein